MLAFAVAALLAAPIDVAPINDGNALTLPAQRHLVRLDPQNGRAATWLLALQQDGQNGRGLGWYRSDDEGQSWSYYAPIQNDASHTDRVDLIQVGMDLAIVYSYEGPTVYGSSRHNVWFQWWRWDGNRDWNPSAPVLVLASPGNNGGYLRGELARDSRGRIWVNAARIESDGTFTVCIAVSTDGGNSFTQEPSLAHYRARPGGRILSLNGRMMLLYGTHSVDPGQMRLRNDSDPLESWGPEITAFPEGLYHGAALSAATDGGGGVHLVYKDLTERTFYRFFDGASWSGRFPVETNPDWATQTAITRIGSDLILFWNHPVSTNTDYRYRTAVIRNGSLGPVTTLDDSSGFKGYPAAAEVLPASVRSVPCFYGRTPDASSSGYVALVFTDNAAYVPPALDGGVVGGTDGVVGGTDGGTGGGVDGGTGGGTTWSTVFSDAFNRSATTLGSAWTVAKGAFIVDTRANSDSNAPDQAFVSGLSCGDCSVSADAVGFGDLVELDVRVQGDDRYDLALIPGGHVQLRKHRAGVLTVLADAPSGIADAGSWASFKLTATGSAAVALTGAVNGRVLVQATDAAAVLGAGSAGIATNYSGIWFRNFVVQQGSPAGGGMDGGTADAGSGADAGVADAGSADAGSAPDAGVADAGSGADAGVADAGSADAGSGADAGVADAGSADAGSGGGGGTLFFDSFNRNASGLGPAWTVQAGAFIVDTRANADNNGPDQAFVAGFSCADCSVSADAVGFGYLVELDLRVRGDDRYDLSLLSNGHVQLRKHLGGVVTILADAASGIADTGSWASFQLTASGTAAVSLTGAVNGRVLLRATDGASVLGAGSAGIATNFSGIWFRNFVVTGAGGAGSGGTGGGVDGGPVDAGTGGGVDAGSVDAGAGGGADAGSVDAGTGGGADAGSGGGTLFSDSFNRNANNLGPDWTVLRGAFIATGFANSDNNAQDQAAVTRLSCADCTVSADVIGFGDPVAVDLRVNGDDRYDFTIVAGGHVQLRKHQGGVITVLADAPSGIADTGSWSTLSLTASGAGPVALVGQVRGGATLSATDASGGLAAGSAGISASLAGIWFRNFLVTGAGGGGGGTGGIDGGAGGGIDAGVDGGSGGGTDGGTDGGSAAGTDGGVDAGTSMTASITYTGVDYDILAVDNTGRAIGNKIGDWNGNVYSSLDGRAWTFTGASGNGYAFRIISPLSDGTLLADTQSGSQHVMERSSDHGATWTDVLATGVYYALSPHSYAELDGAVFFLEYQVFTRDNTPIRIWKSSDMGRTWGVAYTFQGTRHGHGLAPDPAHHALWAFFGDTDAQSGAYRSTDGGATWTLVVSTQTGGIVDGTVLPDGAILCGQDITYQPQYPNIARLGVDGAVTRYMVLPGPSYSTHTVRSGGYVVGVTHENGGDVYPPGFHSGQLWGSGDGVHWTQLLDVPELSAQEDTRTDVYFELSTGELVVNVKNAAGYGSDGRGYVLMATQRK